MLRGVATSVAIVAAFLFQGGDAQGLFNSFRKPGAEAARVQPSRKPTANGSGGIGLAPLRANAKLKTGRQRKKGNSPFGHRQLYDPRWLSSFELDAGVLYPPLRRALTEQPDWWELFKDPRVRQYFGWEPPPPPRPGRTLQSLDAGILPGALDSSSVAVQRSPEGVASAAAIGLEVPRHIDFTTTTTAEGFPATAGAPLSQTHASTAGPPRHGLFHEFGNRRQHRQQEFAGQGAKVGAFGKRPLLGSHEIAAGVNPVSSGPFQAHGLGATFGKPGVGMRPLGQRKEHRDGAFESPLAKWRNGQKMTPTNGLSQRSLLVFGDHLFDGDLFDFDFGDRRRDGLFQNFDERRRLEEGSAAINEKRQLLDFSDFFDDDFYDFDFGDRHQAGLFQSFFDDRRRLESPPETTSIRDAVRQTTSTTKDDTQQEGNADNHDAEGGSRQLVESPTDSPPKSHGHRRDHRASKEERSKRREGKRGTRHHGRSLVESDVDHRHLQDISGWAQILQNIYPEVMQWLQRGTNVLAGGSPAAGRMPTPGFPVPTSGFPGPRSLMPPSGSMPANGQLGFNAAQQQLPLDVLRQLPADVVSQLPPEALPPGFTSSMFNDEFANVGSHQHSNDPFPANRIPTSGFPSRALPNEGHVDNHGVHDALHSHDDFGSDHGGVRDDVGRWRFTQPGGDEGFHHAHSHDHIGYDDFHGHDREGHIGHDREGHIGHDREGHIGHDREGHIGHDREGHIGHGDLDFDIGRYDSPFSTHDVGDFSKNFNDRGRDFHDHADEFRPEIDDSFREHGLSHGGGFHAHGVGDHRLNDFEESVGGGMQRRPSLSEYDDFQGPMHVHDSHGHGQPTNSLGSGGGRLGSVDDVHWD